MTTANISDETILDLVGLLREASDGALEAVYNDLEMVRSYTAAEIAAREREPGAAFRCERLNPESVDSIKAAHRDLVTAMFHLPYERFDELVGAQGDAFGILARRAPGGMAFDIERLAPGQEPQPGWILVGPVAAPGQLDAFARDMERTLNTANFAELHKQNMAEHARKTAAKDGSNPEGLTEAPSLAGATPAPRPTSFDEAHDSARFTLARMWALNNEAEFLSHGFKSVHGMSAEAAFKVAMQAVAPETSRDVAPTHAPRKSLGLSR